MLRLTLAAVLLGAALTAAFGATRSIERQPASAAGSMSRIVGVGDVAPEGGVFRGLSFANLADDGSVFFQGNMCTDTCDAYSIFRYAGDDQEVIVRRGDPAPGGGTLDGIVCSHPGGFGSVVQSGLSDLIFVSTVNLDGTVSHCQYERLGVYRAGSSGLVTVAETGDEIDGNRIASASGAAISSSGVIAAVVCVGDCTPTVYVFFGGVTLRAYARGDEVWPGARLTSIFGPIDVDNSGNIVSHAYIEEDSTTRPCILFFELGFGRHTRIGCDGDALPGGDKLDYYNYGHAIPAMNDGGEVVFANGSRGIYRWNGVTTAVAKVGDPTPLGGTYRAVINPRINDRGQVSFTAEVELDDGSRVYALFVHEDGTTQALYVGGVDVPDRCLFNLDLNNTGQALLAVHDCFGTGFAYYLADVPLRDAPPPTPAPTQPQLIWPFRPDTGDWVVIQGYGGHTGRNPSHACPSPNSGQPWAGQRFGDCFGLDMRQVTGPTTDIIIRMPFEAGTISGIAHSIGVVCIDVEFHQVKSIKLGHLDIDPSIMATGAAVAEGQRLGSLSGQATVHRSVPHLHYSIYGDVGCRAFRGSSALPIPFDASHGATIEGVSLPPSAAIPITGSNDHAGKVFSSSVP